MEEVKRDADDISPPQKRPHLILKIHVTLPPHTLSVVPVRVTDPEVVNSNQYVISDVDPNFEAQYPDVAMILLVHHMTDKNHQDLVVCLINPGEWEVVLPNNKTVQKIMPVCGHVQINQIAVQGKKVKQSNESVPMQKNIPSRTGTVMPVDYTPHQQYELKDPAVSQKARDKLENLL